jgi:hypothetical protein
MLAAGVNVSGHIPMLLVLSLLVALDYNLSYQFASWLLLSTWLSYFLFPNYLLYM